MRTLSDKLTTALALVLLTGCGFGSATVEGDIAGYGFNIRTVYAWIDQTSYDATTGKFVPAETKSLYVVLSGANFDPSEDQRFVSVEEQLARLQEEMLNGKLSFTIRNFQKMKSGDTVTKSTVPGETKDGEPSLNLNFDFAAEEVAPDAEYPEGPVHLGSRITYSVTMDSVDGAPGDELSGTLTMNFTKSDYDTDKAWLGSLTVKFTAVLISELSARCLGGTLRPDSACDVDKPDLRYGP